MGAVIRILKRSRSTTEILEDINKEIELRRKLHQRNLHLQRKYAVSLVLYSAIAYIASGILLVAYYFPTLEWKYRLLCAIPFVLFPFLIWLLRKVLHWYFVKRIEDNDAALQELKERKKNLLEEVMEKETYKKAREILEKFDPEQFKKLEKNNEEGVGTSSAVTPQRPPLVGSDLRRRHVGGPLQTPASHVQLMSTPAAPSMLAQGAGASGIPHHVQGHSGPQQVPRLPLPRHIPPRDRSAMDRLMEYLVGDGPNQRYALICNQCLSHNGMALKEEFEYLSFRCCYCYSVNLARKQRPNAPLLERQRPVDSPDGGADSEGNEADPIDGRDPTSDDDEEVEKYLGDEGTEEDQTEEDQTDSNANAVTDAPAVELVPSSQREFGDAGDLPLHTSQQSH